MTTIHCATFSDRLKKIKEKFFEIYDKGLIYAIIVDPKTGKKMTSLNNHVD
jgi:hypothetical protein